MNGLGLSFHVARYCLGLLAGGPGLGRFGTTKSTAGKAIALLQAEGLVRTETSRGTFVQDIPKVKRVRRIPPRGNGWGSSFAEEMREAGLTPGTKLVQAASVLGTTASIAGTWITKQHDDRTDARLTLETVTTSLNLIGQSGGYAPSAQVAGALATLIHLDHPVIAIRSLRAAWLDQVVDTETATWLIGEVLDSGRNESQCEAARLLFSKASALCGPLRGSDRAFDIHWPYRLYGRWPFQLPLDARMDVLRTLMAMLLSKPYSSWRRTGYYWIIALLDDALIRDRDPSLCAEAGYLQNVLLQTIPDICQISWGRGWKSVEDMRHRAARAVAEAPVRRQGPIYPQGNEHR